MAALTLERGRLRLAAGDKGTVLLQGAHTEDETVQLTGADLHWLVVVAGPAMLAHLGGPLAARGIEPQGPPRKPQPKEDSSGRK